MRILLCLVLVVGVLCAGCEEGAPSNTTTFTIYDTGETISCPTKQSKDAQEAVEACHTLTTQEVRTDSEHAR